MVSSSELEMELFYCATPSRLAQRKDEICKFVVDKGYLPFHPFHAFPYEFYEGHPKVGRRASMNVCLKAVRECHEFGLFGVSDGTLEELVYAIKLGKKIRLFMDEFDPEWRKFYEGLGLKYGDPLRELSNLTTVEEICRGYVEWMKTDGVLSCSLFEPSAEKIVSKFNCGQEQIKEFSKILLEYKNLRASYKDMLGGHKGINDLASFYLQDLMRVSKENEFILDFRKANKKGVFLCWVTCPSSQILSTYQSKRELKIYGSVGDNLGYGGDNISITIEGDAGKNVGVLAKNCEIYIRGNYKSISKDVGSRTKIYQKK